MTSFALRRRKDDDDPGASTSDSKVTNTATQTSTTPTRTQSGQSNTTPSTLSSTTPTSHSAGGSVGGASVAGLTTGATTLTLTTPFVQFTAPTPSPTLQASSPSPHSGQSAVAIAFETIGALIGLILLVCLLRFIYSYRKTPHYDRVAEAIQRHRLYREMMERDRSSVGSSGTHAVLPAYEPRPPSFVSNESRNPFEDPLEAGNVSDHGSPFRDPSPDPDSHRHLV